MAVETESTHEDAAVPSITDGKYHASLEHDTNTSQPPDHAGERSTDAQRMVERMNSLMEGLADAGEASQDRISLLLDAVEAGSQAREELLRVIDDAHDCGNELRDVAGAKREALDTRIEEALTAGRQRVEEWSAQERSRFDARTGQLNTMVDRASSLIEDGIARIQDASIKRSEKWEQTVSRDRDRMEAMTQDAERRLGALVEQKIAEVQASLSTRIEGLIEQSLADARQMIGDVRDRSVGRLSQLADEGVERVQILVDKTVSRVDTRVEELEKQNKLLDDMCQELTQLATRESMRLERTAGVRIDDLSRKAETHAKQLELLVTEQQQRLASQLQAAGESARMLSELTQKSSATLNEQRKQHTITFDQLKQLQASTELARDCSKTLNGTLEEAGTVGTNVRHAVDGTSATVEKIECLIQDIWTLSTTAQENTRQLSRSNQQAEQTTSQLMKQRDEAEAVCGRLASHDADAKRRLEDVSVALAKTESVLSRAESKLEGAVSRADAKMKGTLSQTDAKMEQLTSLIRDADAKHHRLGEVMPLADETTSHVVQTIESAENARRRMSDEVKSAEEQLERLEALRIANHEVAKSLDEVSKVAESTNEALDDRIERATRMVNSVKAITQEATETSREVSQLLANVLDRAEMLDASDERLSQFLERVTDIQSRTQQLETRTDAFTHQLNSMMADPKRIIDDAKVQAAHLDKVCGAVRKVFSGLSQASLQANRDITRFSEVSREANGRLSQLSAETAKSSQTLREWVDEAKHVQTRLSRTLTRVPTLNQSHSGSSLEGLETASREALSSSLKPLGSTPMRPRRRFSSVTDTSEKNTDEPTTSDFAGWIQDAEELASSASE